MKVLVVGSGGREHALAWRLGRDGAEVHVAPGNGGTAAVATNHEVAATDVAGQVGLARELGVDLVVVGPEAPLVEGLVDALAEAGIPAFGPSREAARLEGSKVFAKELMAEAGVPTAGFRIFDDADAAEAWCREAKRPLVVKADGLAAGKGVVVAKDTAEACAAIDRIMRERAFGEAGDRVLVEETLVGPEVSYHVLCSGEAYVPLAAAQDHKRLGDGDQGPNTGGMGAYSPPPMVDAAVEEAIQRQVVEPTLKTMAARGTPFRGVLFIGLMIVDGAPQVLEYNVRFGDPECECLMARWGGDLAETLLAAARGELDSVRPTWDAPAALCVVLASEGYPGSYPKGRAITGVERAEALGTTVFQAGTRRDGETLVTSGGRVLTVTATGADLDEAAERAYAAVDAIAFEGSQHRRDIGWQARGQSSPR
ncbi:MAG: phosphoribosylamine--glycine ligase [Sandaracinus sp.]|nr:phosphoribosylamine--glycine ligase [Sandaracinus sp.]